MFSFPHFCLSLSLCLPVCLPSLSLVRSLVFSLSFSPSLCETSPGTCSKDTVAQEFCLHRQQKNGHTTPKLAGFEHVTRHDSLSQTILQGTLDGGRRCGRQRKCLVENIKGWTSLLMPELLTRASCRKRLEEDLCWIAPHVPPATQSVKGPNWTELRINWLYGAADRVLIQWLVS